MRTKVIVRIRPRIQKTASVSAVSDASRIGATNHQHRQQQSRPRHTAAAAALVTKDGGLTGCPIEVFSPYFVLNLAIYSIH